MTTRILLLARTSRTVALSLALACSRGAAPSDAPAPAQAQKPVESHFLSVAPLAGQPVSVLPLTMVAADSSMMADSALGPYRDRRTGLHRADSLMAELLQGRAPEVHWVLPADLRKVARRAPGMVTDPDQMGQAMMRAPNLTKIPDPLRSYLRSLTAIAGGRVVLIPAALGFNREPDRSVRASLSVVLGDSRTGNVLWRSMAAGTGATPDAALNAALATILPPE
ncbi:MAG: hypothetical protein H0U85_07640 [Gemmatimonadales bacterium]|nr:hypothetical protein [Gemmatimonadales bacterium]